MPSVRDLGCTGISSADCRRRSRAADAAGGVEIVRFLEAVPAMLPRSRLSPVPDDAIAGRHCGLRLKGISRQAPSAPARRRCFGATFSSHPSRLASRPLMPLTL